MKNRHNFFGILATAMFAVFLVFFISCAKDEMDEFDNNMFRIENPVPTIGVDEFPGANKRDFSEFMAAQKAPYFDAAPYQNFNGWSEYFPGTFIGRMAYFDYFGTADEHLNLGLNTQVRLNGPIWEEPLKNGRARVTVNLRATRMLAWATDYFGCEICGNKDPNQTPVVFGNRGQEVMAGAPAAMGEMNMRFVFTIDHPGAPLPNLMPAFFDPEHYPVDGFAMLEMTMEGKAYGELHHTLFVESPWVEGQPGYLYVKRAGAIKKGVNPETPWKLENFFFNEHKLELHHFNK